MTSNTAAEAPAPMAAQFADATFVLEVTEPAEHTVRMATACNYDVFAIQPGRYAVSLTNIDGTSWDADPLTPTNGYIANIGPYYARVTADAIHTHRHIVDRLLTATKSNDTYPNTATSVTESRYAYLVADGARGPFGGYFRLVAAS